MLNDLGFIVVACFISPKAQDRLRAKQIIGEDRFHEVYIKASLTDCILRDCKGFYKKAIMGEIENFTGISQDYEEPLNPDLIIYTSLDIQNCLNILKQYYE